MGWIQPYSEYNLYEIPVVFQVSWICGEWWNPHAERQNGAIQGPMANYKFPTCMLLGMRLGDKSSFRCQRKAKFLDVGAGLSYGVGVNVVC